MPPDDQRSRSHAPALTSQLFPTATFKSPLFARCTMYYTTTAVPLDARVCVGTGVPLFYFYKCLGGLAHTVAQSGS